MTTTLHSYPPQMPLKLLIVLPLSSIVILPTAKITDRSIHVEDVVVHMGLVSFLLTLVFAGSVITQVIQSRIVASYNASCVIIEIKASSAVSCVQIILPPQLTTLVSRGCLTVVRLGDGMSLTITHTGTTSIPTQARSLALSNILRVPHLHKNRVPVAKLCNTNNVSVEFSSSHFLVKDRVTGASLVRVENIHDVYYVPNYHPPQLHATQLFVSPNWYHILGHPSGRILSC
ncbi:unnamed protein product [Cuscuta epithymum]|uniref:Uncharacterized protein n=1 Tax=Cuscuta epithymum TaxID=186058 RepID=A0AAV0C1Q6_9ASTE|nr:unnamed protein product [Cuscuta epithymum]